jgi:hypothetical protein
VSAAPPVQSPRPETLSATVRLAEVTVMPDGSRKEQVLSEATSMPVFGGHVRAEFRSDRVANAPLYRFLNITEHARFSGTREPDRLRVLARVVPLRSRESILLEPLSLTLIRAANRRGLPKVTVQPQLDAPPIVITDPSSPVPIRDSEEAVSSGSRIVGLGSETVLLGVTDAADPKVADAVSMGRLPEARGNGYRAWLLRVLITRPAAAPTRVAPSR